ncbi:MAG: rRNA maturation RNase YbeY [Bacteroidetes bacterium]|nr:rRNA maturation RNase YbeY [Bacteroidota bacterium]
MEQTTIFFHEENISFDLQNEEIIVKWISKSIKDFEKIPGDINFIFTSDEALHKINHTYLDHDDFTDVITFDYSEGDEISGDIYISIDRVRENADNFDQSFENEIHRVMIHSILHLLGFDDKSDKDKTEMTRKEDFYLSLLPPISR